MGAAPRLRECVLGLTSSLTHMCGRRHLRTLLPVLRFTLPDKTRASMCTHTCQGAGIKYTHQPTVCAVAHTRAQHAHSAMLLDGAQTSHQGCSRAPVCRERRGDISSMWGRTRVEGFLDDLQHWACVCVGVCVSMHVCGDQSFEVCQMFCPTAPK